MARKILTDINLNKNELQNAIIQNLASDPSNPVAGQVYFNTTTNRFRVYTGTEWDEMGTGGGTVTSVTVSNDTDGGLSVSGNPITSSGTITIGHSNVLASAQTTSGLYPIKIDKNGHITEYGTAVGTVSTTADGLVPAFSNENKDTSTAIANTDYIYDATTGKYQKLPAEAFSDTTYTDGTSGYVEKAKEDANGNQIDTTYAPLASPALTGTPTAPTATSGDNSTQIATTAFVQDAVSNLEGAMHYKGTVTGGTLPSTGVANGDTYKVAENGTYGGQAAKVGDLFIAVVSGGTITWTYVPSADDTAVTSITAGTGLTGGTITTTGTIALDESGVTAGTYNGFTVDAYGRITSATNLTLLSKYTTTLAGDGTTRTFTVTHNLGSRDVTIQVYDASSYEEVIVDVTRTNTNTATIGFASAPAVGTDYKVVVIG